MIKMENVELISVNNSSFKKEHGRELKFWPTIRKDWLKSFSHPFILFLDYYSLKENFAKFNEIGANKNLLSVVLSVDGSLFTSSWRELEMELKRSALKKIQTFDNEQSIERLIHSWKIHAQDDLIADFKVAGEYFYLIGCNLQEIRGSLREFKVFRDANEEDLSNFVLDEHGSFIHWPKLDVDLDMNSFKAKFEEGFDKKLKLKKVEKMSEFGGKLKKFRESNGLNQSSFEGINPKTIGRYEKGEYSISYKNLQKISQKFGLSVDRFIQEVNQV